MTRHFCTVLTHVRVNPETRNYAEAATRHYGNAGTRTRGNAPIRGYAFRGGDGLPAFTEQRILVTTRSVAERTRECRGYGFPGSRGYGNA